MNFRATARCLITVTTLTFLFAACAVAPRTARDHLSARFDGVRVIVDNQNWEAMAVYVLRSGTPIRLGIVEGLSTRTLAVPSSFMGNTGEVELMGQTRISDVRHRLPAVPWNAGRTLHVTLGSRPHLSLIRVF